MNKQIKDQNIAEIITTMYEKDSPAREEIINQNKGIEPGWPSKGLNLSTYRVSAEKEIKRRQQNG